MQRYFSQLNDSKEPVLTEADVFHIVKVMRGRINDQFELVIEGKVYVATISSINPFKYAITDSLDEERELDVNTTLLYCLPKGDKLDLVIQKCTELGVNHIIGVISSRTVVRLEDNKKAQKIERYNKIMKEAAEQSHRAVIPTFDDIINYDDLSKYHFDHMFIAYEGEAKNENTLYSLLEKVESGETLAFLVGAEGGFSEDEVILANKYGYKSVSLGKRILRSETAAIYAMTVVSFLRESK